MLHLKPIFFLTIMTLFFLEGVEPVKAFKGIGSSSPETGQESMANMAKMQHQGNQDVVVALVNGAEIKMGALMSNVLDVIMRKYGGKEVTSEIAKRIREEALERLAMEELAYQRAVILGISINPDDINTKIESLKQKAGGEEAFQNNLSRQNKSLNQLKEEIRRYMSVEAAVEQEVNSMASVDDKEVEKLYQENREQFIIPEQIIITDIIFFLDHEDASSKAKVQATRQEIIETYDNNPAKIPPDGFAVQSEVKISMETAPAFYKTSRQMKQGDLSSPFIIDSTYHVIKLDYYQPATEKPKNEVKAYIAGTLTSQKRKQVLDKWRKDLLKNANIEIVHELLQ
jgi:foldase protein PrsA